MKKWMRRLLPGVEVKFYQGANGVWHADVLLDKDYFPDHDALPKRGNRPLTDSGSNRWWYDESQGLYDYQVARNGRHVRRVIHYTPREARQLLDRRVAELLIEIMQVRLAERMQTVVANVEHREHWEWTRRQDQRRNDWLANGLPPRLQEAPR